MLHLKALANLSRRLIHEDFRNDLLNAKSKVEILEMFSFQGRIYWKNKRSVAALTLLRKK